MRRATIQSMLGLLGVGILMVGLSGPAMGQEGPPATTPGQPFAEIQALIGILSDKIEAVQESVDTLSHGGGEGHPTLRWDQVLPAGDRFEILAAFTNEAVLDKETGLVWEQAPLTTQHQWAQARSQCTSRETGGRKGWRLPSVHELASLVDPAANTTLVLPTGHPFTGVQPAAYWSATTIAVAPGDAGGVGFGTGTVSLGNKITTFHVWCVRGGMNADEY